MEEDSSDEESAEPKQVQHSSSVRDKLNRSIEIARQVQQQRPIKKTKFDEPV